MDQLRERVAIVTGGSSGIGLGIAGQLAVSGCKVVIVGRTLSTLEAAAQTIGATAIQADVTDLAQVHRLARQVSDLFGRVDILVNNAGVGPTAPLSQMTASDWQWMVQANLWSVTNGLEVFLPLLMDNPNGGHIVNTSSIAGMFTAPEIGAYSASKYAVTALTEALAQELSAAGSQVGVSLFLPGPVRSNIHEGGRNRPAWARDGKLRDTRLEDAPGFENVVIPWMEPDKAGAIVVDAIRRNRLYVWTHPEGTQPILDRFNRIRRSIEEAQEGR